jgi:hypothetical protein
MSSWVRRCLVPFAAMAVLAGAASLACGRAQPLADDPVPMPTPTPAPTPALPAASLGCRLPPGAGDGIRCPYQYATFVEPVDKAIAQLQREHPEIFDLAQCYGALSCRVLNRDRYIAGMLDNLRAMHLCAIFDGEEIVIKNTNDFSDQYNVISSSGFSRWGIGSYRATCRPAWF